MLDTEGLQSPERIDAEYDRKIVLFAMLSADILIINKKGEIMPRVALSHWIWSYLILRRDLLI